MTKIAGDNPLNLAHPQGQCDGCRKVFPNAAAENYRCDACGSPLSTFGTRTMYGRPFRVKLPDEPDMLQGVQFPSGRCVLDHPSRGIWYASTTFEDLNDAIDLSTAQIEWADGGTP